MCCKASYERVAINQHLTTFQTTGDPVMPIPWSSCGVWKQAGVLQVIPNLPIEAGQQSLGQMQMQPGVRPLKQLQCCYYHEFLNEKEDTWFSIVKNTQLLAELLVQFQPCSPNLHLVVFTGIVWCTIAFFSCLNSCLLLQSQTWELLWIQILSKTIAVWKVQIWIGKVPIYITEMLIFQRVPQTELKSTI